MTTRLKYLLLVLLLLPVAYNACSKSVFYSTTTVGNPYSPVANEILYGMCGVISRCNPQVTVDRCQLGLSSTSGFSTPLGLQSNYSTFSSIIQAESSGALVGNTVAAANCYDAINSLSCSDPTVVGAYNESQANPYSGAPAMIPQASCNQSFTTGVNIEVPIEMVEAGLSSNTTPVTFSRTRTSLDTGAYDGTVTYTFEVTATNTDTVSRNVYLVDASGTQVLTLQVPNNNNPSSNPVRYSTTFAPTSGASNYRIELDGTTSANQLTLYEGRILVTQVGATKTKVYVPLTTGAGGIFQGNTDDYLGAIDNTPSTTYTQQSAAWYTLWKKNNSAFSQLASGSPWTFEAVISDSGGTAYASLFDATTGLQVAASEVSTNSSNPTLVSANFADSATNFTNLDNMTTQVKTTAGKVYVYRAGLWITLTSLTHAEVYYRNMSLFHNTSASGQDVLYNRVVYNASAFSAPTVYFQFTGYVSASGTSCQAALFDNGTADVGFTGSNVTGSNLTVNSLTTSIQRSGPLNVTSGDRFTTYLYGNPGPGTCSLNSFLVVGF